MKANKNIFAFFKQKNDLAFENKGKIVKILWQGISESNT